MAPQTYSTYQGEQIVYSVAVADLNGDGKPDIITLGYSYISDNPFATISVLLGNGDGTFQPAQTFKYQKLSLRRVLAPWRSRT